MAFVQRSHRRPLASSFIAERGDDALTPIDPALQRRRLRPELRAHLEAVIDSFSDDETANFLDVGIRQVRRRAQTGRLYFFSVGKRRRYATWQFDERLGVLPGLGEVVASFPADWQPEDAHQFMLTPAPELTTYGQPLTPRRWLCLHHEPSPVIMLLQRHDGPNK